MIVPEREAKLTERRENDRTTFMSELSEKMTLLKSHVRPFPLLMTGIIGLVVSFYLFLEASLSEQYQMHYELQNIANERIYAITDTFNDFLQVLTELKAFYESTTSVDRNQFKGFTQPLLAYHSGLRALEWIPLVKDAQRETYRESARKDGLNNYRITERNNVGQLVRAERRAEYFPIYYVEPLKGNEAAVGYDLSSETTRRSALNIARRTGLATATAPITLVQETAKEFGTIVFAPVYESNAARRLRGFAMVVLRLKDAVKEAIKSLTPQDVDIYVFDTTDASTRNVIVMMPSSLRAHVQDHNLGGATVNKQSGITRTINFAGRKYEIEIRPTAEFIASRKTWLPWLELVTGLILTSLITLYLWRNMTRTAEIEAQVTQRTKELDSQTRRYRLLMQTSNDAIHIWDMKGNLREYNNAFLSHLGYTPDEAHSLRVMDWNVQLGPEQLLNKLSPLFTKGHVFETQHRRKDGSIVVVEINATGVQIDGEDLIYASARDITLRKKAEEAVKAAAREWSASFDAMADGVSLHSANYTILNVNHSLCTMLGKGREELIGKKCYEVFHGANSPIAGCPLERATETLRKEYAEIFEPAVNLWLAVTTAPILDDSGRVSKIVHTIRDITERKRADQSLLESEEKYRSLVESTDDSIYVVDRNYKYLHINKKHMARMDISGEEYIGRAYSEFHGDEETRLFIRDVDKVFETGEPVRREYKSNRDNKYFAQTLSPVKNSTGQSVAVTIISKDITKHKNMEEKLRTLSLTDELTGLYNRRGFFTLCDQILKLCRRQKKAAFLLYADLDHLKEINDRLGHQEGDKILVETADIFKKTFRDSDIIARIGGDEFIVFPVGSTKEDSASITARFLRKIESYNEKKAGKYVLSISFGTSCYDPENPCSIDELVAEAEKLMYVRKKDKQIPDNEKL